jgi:hypothetical protein
MTYTSTHPTTPGFYVWKYCEIDDGKSVVFFTKKDIADGEIPPGTFCRLVPAEEVEKAFSEGYDDAYFNPADQKHIRDGHWEESHAKKVCEGKAEI